MKTYIQTVYIPRENIFFVEEWLSHHRDLGIDEFFMYDNTGSYYQDFIGNFMADGRNKHGINVKELTSELTDLDIEHSENEIFKKYNAKRIKWQPKDNNGYITYGQTLAIDDFIKYQNQGYCAFIDIDEFIILNKHKSIKSYIEETIENRDGIRILQKKYLNRWYSPRSVKNITINFPVSTEYWGPKIIADLSKISKCIGNIHQIVNNIIIDRENCWFNHYNHEENSHNWLIQNKNNMDPNWIPFDYKELFIGSEFIQKF